MTKLNLPDEFREMEEWLSECEAMTKAACHKTTHSAITLSQARHILTSLSDARNDIEIKGEIIQELIDSINERGDKIQKLMQSSGKDWVGIYDVTDENGDTYHICDNKSGVDLQDNAIIVYIVELEAEINELKSNAK